MRRNVIISNWYTRVSLSIGQSRIKDINKKLSDLTTYNKDKNELILACSTNDLYSLKEMYKDSDLKFAAQDISEHKSGAYTGQVSAEMVKSAGADYTIIGDYTRRIEFNESNEMHLRKLNLAIENDLGVIFCVSDTEADFLKGRSHRVIQKQLESVIFTLSPEKFEKIIIVYQPIWALTSKNIIGAERTQGTASFIRHHIREKYGCEMANNTAILNGGNTTTDTVREFYYQPDIDGSMLNENFDKKEVFIENLKILIDQKNNNKIS